MRLFAAIAMLLLALPSNGQKQQKAADEHTDVAVQAPAGTTVVAPAVTPGVGYSPTVVQQNCPLQNAYDWPQIFTGIGLIAVGIGGVWVGVRTLKKIEIQATAAKKAADAAQDSATAAKNAAEAGQTQANAMMIGERAWLLIDGLDADPDFAKQAIPSFTYRVSNYGKTLGFMISAKAYVQLVPDFNHTEDIDFMERDGGSMNDSTVTPQGEPLCLFGNDLTAHNQRFLLYELSQEERSRLFRAAPTAYLWAVGSISYRDVFGEVRHTSFAYWWHVTDHKFIRVRWPGYNRPT